MLPRNRLLTRIAPLLEVDRPSIQPGLGGEHAIVDLATEARRPGADAQKIELVLADLVPVGRLLVDHLVRGEAEVLRGDAARWRLAADDHGRRMRLELDRALRGEAGAEH